MFFLKKKKKNPKPDLSLTIVLFLVILSYINMVNLEAYQKLRFFNLCNLKVNYPVCGQGSSLFVSS